MSIVIGLTGGTGCGKSTIAQHLQKAGAFIIDADAIAREIVKPGQPALLEIANAFPNILFSDGSLNRKKLGNIVFSDKNELKRLNQITHTYIIKSIKEFLKNETCPLVVIDAPLLIECNLHSLCTFSIAVLADYALRLERIMKRDGLTEEQAKKRIEAQPEDNFYRQHCDYIIENNQNETTLAKELDNILKEFDF